MLTPRLPKRLTPAATLSALLALSGLGAGTARAAASPAVPVGGTPEPAALHRPDARIRLACAYTTDWQPCEPDWVGDGVYNTSAKGQKSRWTDYLTYSNHRDPHVIVFKISIENDGSGPDAYSVSASGVTSGYRIKFLRGTTDITAAVAAGTYRTPPVSEGGAHVIKAKVVMPCHSWDSCGQDRASRLVTIRSVGDPAIADAVKLVREIWTCTC